MINHFIIEGIDNIGKGTLISQIEQNFGHHHYIHYEKPRELEIYGNDLEKYQKASFVNGFELLCTGVKTIYDRFHLGEEVYAPLYRNYSGKYVFDMERDILAKSAFDSLLVLLYSSNLGIIIDDGLSIDASNQVTEQIKFITAFKKSKFQNKVIVDVYDVNTGKFKDPCEILDEVMSY